ncbi:MAG: hypothetical protein COS40_11180 [Deltaproteobacteria bacterium CG03_land_8_20_14_0_80_45_14]|nr:MAG: hypothetical protein COS40_11180 [Deltaproteobacteria bacterium CG03_land_8_20_14_0_80_45_14]
MRKTIDVDKSNPPSPPFAKGGMWGFSGQKGVTLTELLVVLAIFSIVIAGVYGVYIAQVKHTAREYRVAESEMEMEIIKNFIERDIAMAGYGLADDYTPCTFSPRAFGATDNTGSNGSDTMTLMGTALGRLSRGAQGWTYITSSGVSPPTFKTWNDAREDVKNGDWVIYMEPSTKSLLTSGGCASSAAWLFTYPASPSTERGTLIYGLHTENANFPYYAVEYSLGGTPVDICAPPASGANAVLSLERAESKDTIPPPSGTRRPVLDCVRDLQVAFGVDANEDGTIDCWDNGGVLAATYDNKALKKRLKQARVYMLVQLGRRDPDKEVYPSGQTFIVGDTTLTECNGGTVGRSITLTDEQRRYRWRVVSLSIAPRNLR